MSLPMGQEPSNTDGQEPTDTYVPWRGRLWHFAGAEDPPPAGDPQPADPTTTAPVTPPRGQEPPERYDAAYVADLRKSEAATRKRATELEAKLKAQDDAKLSETERLTKANAELEARLASANAAHDAALIRAAVEREAHTQGAVKADVVYRLVDRSAITLDESGEVKGADRAVKALLEAEPYLKATAGGTAPINGPPRQNGAPTTKEDRVQHAAERMAQSGRYGRL